VTGLERNADIVTMTSYAPLFAHIDGWQWTPDLIWFDNLRSYGTPNYYVQKLFATNRGTHILSAVQGNTALTGQSKLYASAVWDKNTKEIIVKVVNASTEEQTKEIVLEGAGRLNAKATVTILKSESLEAVNSLENPMNIKPVDQPLNIKGKKISITLPPHSFSVLKIQQSK
jgi:alpha-N-arabinofuranosidase